MQDPVRAAPPPQRLEAGVDHDGRGATEASPSSAARRPRAPAVAARRPATAMESFAWSAARDSALKPRSSVGVGLAAIAA